MLNTQLLSQGLEHKIGGGCCRFDKTFVPESCVCPACAEISKKEDSAKKAEIKKREEALAAQIKAENEARENERKEQLIALENEKQRKAEEEAQLKREAEDAKRKVDELFQKYNEQNKVVTRSGSKNGDFIVELESFSDHSKKVFGLKLQDSVLFTKEFPAEVLVTINRLGKTNYFLLHNYYKNKDYDYSTFNNTMQIMNMYGEIIKIDGKDLFYSVSFDEESESIKVRHLEQSLIKSHGDPLEGFGSDINNRHPSTIYSSLTELITVHEALVEKRIAAHKAKYANSTQKGGVSLTIFGYLYSGNGSDIITDLHFKILNKTTGIVYTYNSKK